MHGDKPDEMEVQSLMELANKNYEQISIYFTKKFGIILENGLNN